MKKPTLTKPCKYFAYKFNSRGNPYTEVKLRGHALLTLAATNKGTAFTKEERKSLDLEGLLPPVVTTLEAQVARLYRNFKQQIDDLAKYQFLRGLQERSELAFYALLQEHLTEMMPIIYTPTVGKAVQKYSALYQTPRGITISRKNMHRADQIMKNYLWDDVRMIVATDSSAILGIGDQGHGGLAICIGKLALYTAGAGVNPFHTMPVDLDVGTNRKDLINDPHYLGMKHLRLRGEKYFEIVDRFVEAACKRWPNAVIQWEDFAKQVAFEVLERYQDKVPSFNDDIQGTGAVVLAGLLSACKKKGEHLRDQRIVIAGAGAGGIGVARAIRDGMVKEGLTQQQARRQLFVLDVNGLVIEGITPDSYKLSVSQFADTCEDWQYSAKLPQLMDVIENGKPTVLLGLTGIPGLFNQPIVEGIAKNTEQPIIFPLSNPTPNCEALPEDIINWTQGKAIVASGSPFHDVHYQDKTLTIGQGNNAFIFPGLGLATILGKCTRITDNMVTESAYALSEFTNEHYLQQGLIYPPVDKLQEASIRVAARVLMQAIGDGVSSRKMLPVEQMEEYIRSRFWKAEYMRFVPSNDATSYRSS